MTCIFDIKPEDRHCELCLAYCSDKPDKSTETSSTTEVNIP